jgi:hypothetical protein
MPWCERTQTAAVEAPAVWVLVHTAAVEAPAVWVLVHGLVEAVEVAATLVLMPWCGRTQTAVVEAPAVWVLVHGLVEASASAAAALMHGRGSSLKSVELNKKTDMTSNFPCKKKKAYRSCTTAFVKWLSYRASLRNTFFLHIYN